MKLFFETVNPPEILCWIWLWGPLLTQNREFFRKFDLLFSVLRSEVFLSIVGLSFSFDRKKTLRSKDNPRIEVCGPSCRKKLGINGFLVNWWLGRALSPWPIRISYLRPKLTFDFNNWQLRVLYSEKFCLSKYKAFIFTDKHVMSCD